MPDEIKYLRANARVQGSVFFSSTSLLNNPLGFTDSLKETYYRHPALPPLMLWLDSVPPNAPRNLTVKAEGNLVKLHWETPLPAKDKEPVFGYVIYRFEGTEKIDMNDPKNILKIQYNTELFFTDKTTLRGKTYSYIVTAIDRLTNESERTPTMAVTIR
jgi:hypothetical protein